MVSNKCTGFNLIEVMIVICIISILLAIAYPSYQNQVRKTKRVEMKVTMQDIVHNIQRYKVAHFSVIGAQASDFDLQSRYPLRGTALYNLSLSPLDENNQLNSESWQLIATPIAGTAQAKDGSLLINSKGQKCWTENRLCTLTTTSNWDGK